MYNLYMNYTFYNNNRGFLILGILFILYNSIILGYGYKNKWNIKQVIFLCFLSLVPFGTSKAFLLSLEYFTSL